MNLVAKVEFMKMSTPQEKAQCISWFMETKSDIRLKLLCSWIYFLLFQKKAGQTTQVLSATVKLSLSNRQIIKVALVALNNGDNQSQKDTDELT